MIPFTSSVRTIFTLYEWPYDLDFTDTSWVEISLIHSDRLPFYVSSPMAHTSTGVRHV